MAKSNGNAYAAVYDKLRSQIFSGQLKPGNILPSENQLCGEFGVSRETVRKGLKQMEMEQLIYSRPKVGYFVSTPNHSTYTLKFSDEFDNYATQYCDVHGMLPDETVQKMLDISQNRKVIALSQLTLDEAGLPVALDVKYMPYERAYPSVEGEMRYAVLPDLTFSKLSSFEIYTEVTVSAVNASQKIAELLRCEAGATLLMVEQVFVRQDGKKVAYSQRYCVQPAGKLQGTSGHRM